MTIEAIKQIVIENVKKLLQNENILKLIQNENVLSTLSKGLEIKAKIEEEVEAKVKMLQETLSIASVEDLRDLERKFQKNQKKLDKTNDAVDELAKKLGTVNLESIEENQKNIKSIEEDYSQYKDFISKEFASLKNGDSRLENKIVGMTKRLDNFELKISKMEDTLTLIEKNIKFLKDENSKSLREDDLTLKGQEIKDIIELRMKNSENEIMDKLTDKIDELKREIIDLNVKLDASKKSTTKATPKKPEYEEFVDSISNEKPETEEKPEETPPKKFKRGRTKKVTTETTPSAELPLETNEEPSAE